MTLIFLRGSNVILTKKNVPPDTPCYDLAFWTDLLAIEQGCAASAIKVELVRPFRATADFLSLRGAR